MRRRDRSTSSTIVRGGRIPNSRVELLRLGGVHAGRAGARFPVDQRRRRRRAVLHLAGAQGRRPHSGSAGPDARGRQVRLAADPGRRHQADRQRRPDARRRRPAAVQARAVRQLLCLVRRLLGAAVRSGWVGQSLNVAVFFILAVLGLEVFGVILAGYCLGLQMVAVRRHARGGPGRQLRSAAGLVRRRAGADLRHDGPGRRSARCRAGWFSELAHLPRSVHVHHVLGLLHLRDGQREPRAVRPGRGRKRAGGRLSHGVLRPALELLLHGRVRLDVRRQRAGRDPVLRRLERADSDHAHAWMGLRLGRRAVRITGYLANLLGMTNFIVKGMFGVTVMMWVRWTLPRLADRPGDDDLPEVLHADRRGDVRGCRGLAVRAAWRLDSSLGESPGVVRETFVDGGGAIGVAFRGATARVTSLADRESWPRGGRSESAMNWHSFFFLLFALVAGVFAVAVVFTSNIVRMAFYLMLSLGATAGLFFLAGADFVGAMQLLIYVGGTLVLLIFGVMLTAQGPFITHEDRQRRVGDGGDRRRVAVGGACCRRPFQRPRMAGAARYSRGSAVGKRANGDADGHGAAWARALTPTKFAAEQASRAWPATCCRSKSFPCTCWSC